MHSVDYHISAINGYYIYFITTLVSTRVNGKNKK
jgi:hypothetical protein